MKALRELKHAELLKFAKALEQGKFPSYKTRPLTPEEIASLERFQNVCADWSLIRVDHHFDPSKVRRCFLSGTVLLPQFFGTVLSLEGVPLPAGAYDSTINDCILENAHIGHVKSLSRMIVSAGCIIHNVGSLVVHGRTHFGLGYPLQVGSEMGGRSIAVWPEMPFDAAAYLLTNLHDNENQGLWHTALAEFTEQVSSTMGFVGKDAVLSNTQAIRNCWIGPAARIDGAIKVHDCTLLSSVEQPCSLRDGAIVEHSVLQWGAKVRSHAIVSHAFLCEESSAQKHAKVHSSLLGPNTHIHEGEVSSSLLGPFVGFHHQSLLISVLWPDGMGNVAHAASVGSNHTGRQPDQECYAGRGLFFGMGAIIKFPAHYRDAMWTLIAAGVTAPPQKVECPFALIAPGRNPKAFKNEIIPGWVLRYNSFALARSEQKFQQRNKSRRQQWAADIFGAETAQCVVRAYQRLSKVDTILEVYTEDDITGIGKNYLTERNRQRALAWYKTYLERFVLLAMMSQLEKDPALLRSDQRPSKLCSSDILREITRIIPQPESIALIPKHFRNAERRWYETILADFQRDAERGTPMSEDYSLLHNQDDMLAFAAAEWEKAQVRCRELLKASARGAQ